MLEKEIHLFLDSLRLKNYSEHTISNYHIALRQFSSYCEEAVSSLQEIKHQTIRGFLARLHEQGRSAATRESRLGCLRSFFKFLVKEGHIPSSPARLVKYPKKADSLPACVPTYQEVEAIIDAPQIRSPAGVRDSLMELLTEETQMTQPELVALNVKDADPEKGTLNGNRISIDALILLWEYLSLRKEVAKDSSLFISFRGSNEGRRITAMWRRPIVADSFYGLRNRVIVELLYGAALRVHELTSLQVTDVDLNEKALVIRGKGKKERLGLFGSEAKEAIEAYLPVRQKRAKCSYLLINPSGYRLSDRSVQRMLKKLGAQLKMSNLHPHALRHSCATHLHQNGADIRTLQELLGHSSLSTTTIYVRLDETDLQKAIDLHPRNQEKVVEKMPQSSCVTTPQEVDTIMEAPKIRRPAGVRDSLMAMLAEEADVTKRELVALNVKDADIEKGTLKSRRLSVDALILLWEYLPLRKQIAKDNALFIVFDGKNKGRRLIALTRKPCLRRSGREKNRENA